MLFCRGTSSKWLEPRTVRFICDASENTRIVDRMIDRHAMSCGKETRSLKTIKTVQEVSCTKFPEKFPARGATRILFMRLADHFH